MNTVYTIGWIIVASLLAAGAIWFVLQGRRDIVRQQRRDRAREQAPEPREPYLFTFPLDHESGGVARLEWPAELCEPEHWGRFVRQLNAMRPGLIGPLPPHMEEPVEEPQRGYQPPRQQPRTARSR